MQFSYPPELPISAHIDQICSTLRDNQVIIIAGDTGSGKTTQLPKMCIEAGFGTDKKRIGCTQPRRIAAVSVAQRVAHEIDDPEIAGYKIRFQDTLSDKSVIKFMTDGILLAETRHDRMLSQYDVIIIDEAHERSLNIDFLIGYLKRILLKRKDLKLIISSATIDEKKFSEHFSKAPIISVSGRLHPITTFYQDETTASEENNYIEQAIISIEDICTDPFGGDILVFMPTERDIFETIDGLNEQTKLNNTVLPLFGRLQAKDQQKIFYPSKRRKIIISTNVAETSITVPGIRFVIDSGLARISKYNPRTGTTNLRISKISQASCNQRQGRCGRTGPGTCIRLFTEQDYISRDEFTLPEIQRSNLAEVILQMISLQLGKIDDFPFLDSPHPRAVREGFRTLFELRAITENNKLTSRGRIMSSLPLDPRISAIIIEGEARKALREIIIIAAALSTQDPRIRPLDKEFKADEAHRRFIDKNSDFITLLNIWNELFSETEKVSWSQLGKFCKSNFLSWQRMREWIDVHYQISRILKKNKSFNFTASAPEYKNIHIAITYGFLRNICQKKEKNIYISGNGKEISIFPGSSLYKKGGEWIMSSSQVETSQLFARTAANINIEWLEELGGSLCKKTWSNPRWDKKRSQVVADEQVTLFGLPIVSNRKINYGRINKKTREEARNIFIREALIENRLAGHYNFLHHNQKLRKQYLEMEDRMRRKDIVIDDEQIFSFYDKRLGSLYDGFTLNKFLKGVGNDAFLKMEPEDICLKPSAQNELYLFPPQLAVGDHIVELSYLFEPGNPADGVTAIIKENIVNVLPPTFFEWLVPGLLEEKLLFLFKRLPKRLRKQLVPVPQAVDRVMDLLHLYEGSLYQNVEKAVLRAHQVNIKRSDWIIADLPVHLIMRFKVIDNTNKTVASSRSYSELLTSITPNKKTPNHTNTQKTLPNKQDFTYKDLDSTKSIISFNNNGKTDTYYPSFEFTKTGNKINLVYTSSKSESLKTSISAIEQIFSGFFTAEINKIKKECKKIITNNSASFLSLGGNYSAAKLQNDILSHIIRSIFVIEQEVIPSTKSIVEQVEQIKKTGLFRKASPLLKLLIENVQARKQTKQRIEGWADRAKKNKSFSPQRYKEYLNGLNEILPPNFIGENNIVNIQHSCRYLQALTIRVERAEHSPVKDENKAKQLTHPLQLLEQSKQFNAHSKDCIEKLREFKLFIEELRVSIFAPELGTSIKVSSKKLKQLWSEVENNCLLVE